MVNSGPIPGANFTSDTKNYPWHQPPEFTDISDALDKIVQKITEKAPLKSVLGLAELGIPLYRIAGIVIMQGVSEGKWTVDMALLLVGPTTKIIEMICSQFGVEYTLGIEEEEDTEPDGVFYKMSYENQLKKPNKVLSIISEEVEQVKAEAEDQEGPQEEAVEPDIQQEGFAKMRKTPVPTEEEGMI